MTIVMFDIKHSKTIKSDVKRDLVSKFL